MKRFKNKLLIALAILLTISLSLFVFSIIYEREMPKLVEDINNSAIGAIFTAIITVFLLLGQSETEEDKERNVKVFEKKSELFNNFIEELWKVWEDRNITLEELSHLLELVSKDIIPYTKPESAKSILNSLNAIASEVNTQENTANKKHIQNHLYAIINTLSEEIGLGGAIHQDIATELDKLEDSILPYLNKKRYMNKINELVQERLNKTLTNFTIEDDYLWWRVKGEKTGIWLRVGDVDNNGKTYISFWSEFFSYRQYAPYHFAGKGKNKDWLIGDVVYGGFDWNLLRKGEFISSESLNHLADEIVKFYEKPVGETGKTIDEIIKECNPVIEK
jgi:hypothetical protein